MDLAYDFVTEDIVEKIFMEVKKEFSMESEIHIDEAKAKADVKRENEKTSLVSVIIRYYL